MTAAADARFPWTDEGYVVVSDPAATPAVLAGRLDKDLDVLLTPSLFRRTCRALRSAGFQMELKWNSPFKALLFKYRPAHRHLQMLDLYWRYTFSHGGRHYELLPEVVQRLMAGAVRSPDGIRHADGPMRLLFVLLGRLFKGNPRDCYAQELAVLGTHLPALLNWLTGGAGLAAADAAALRGLLCDDRAVPPGVVRRFAHCIARPLPRWRTSVLWPLRHALLSRHVRRRPPPLIAVVGIDGAGKSTLVSEVTRRLPIKVKPIYWASRNMLLPTTRLHRWLERVLLGRDVRRRDRPEHKPLPDAVRRRRGVGHVFKLPLLAALAANKYAEYLAKYALAGLHRARGCILLADRYVCDEELEYDDRFFRINRWLYRHAYPRPELLVVVTAPAETIHARKPSIPLAAAAHHQDVYRACGARHAARGVDVLYLDSQASAADNAEQVVDRLFARWQAAPHQPATAPAVLTKTA